jgi:hypothetical protein
VLLHACRSCRRSGPQAVLVVLGTCACAARRCAPRLLAGGVHRICLQVLCRTCVLHGVHHRDHRVTGATAMLGCAAHVTQAVWLMASAAGTACYGRLHSSRCTCQQEGWGVDTRRCAYGTARKPCWCCMVHMPPGGAQHMWITQVARDMCHQHGLLRPYAPMARHVPAVGCWV